VQQRIRVLRVFSRDLDKRVALADSDSRIRFSRARTTSVCGIPNVLLEFRVFISQHTNRLPVGCASMFHSYNGGDVARYLQDTANSDIAPELLNKQLLYEPGGSHCG
jgi:hypothetical protein